MAATIQDSALFASTATGSSASCGAIDTSGADAGILCGTWSGHASITTNPTSVLTSNTDSFTTIYNSAISAFYNYGFFATVGHTRDATDDFTVTYPQSRDEIICCGVALASVLQTSDAAAFTDAQNSQGNTSSLDPSHTHTGVASGDQLIGWGVWSDQPGQTAIMAETGQVELQTGETSSSAYEQVGTLSHRPGSSGSVIGIDTSNFGDTQWRWASVVVNEAVAGGSQLIDGGLVDRMPTRSLIA